jgi:hypothetical protein
MLTGVLLSTLAVALFCLTAFALGYGRRTALLGTVAFGAGTLLWPYARTLFSEVIAAFGLTLAFYGAARFAPISSLQPQIAKEKGRSKKEKGGGGEDSDAERWNEQPVATPYPIPNNQYPVAAGLFAGLGLAVLTLAKSSNAVVAPFFLLFMAWVALAAWRAGGRVARLVGGLLLAGGIFAASVLATVVYNFARFGTLLSFPLEAYETFSTPLLTGLAGLFVSPGKGLLWYTPLLLLALIGLGVALAGVARGRTGLLLVAAATILAPALLYALWFDWPGGRAWGPRMIAWVTPAVALLALPALDWLAGRACSRALRIAIGAVLAWSLLAQLPGVLVNAELQEIEDFRRGIPFDDLVWAWEHAPLRTYWGAVPTFTRDPLLLHAAFWQSGWPAWLAVAAAGAGMACLWLVWRRGARWLWGAAGAGALLAATLLLGAQGDPRWEEYSALPGENEQVAAALRARAAPEDVIVLDLLTGYDVDGRAWWRANALPAPPAAIGWLRQDDIAPEDGAALAGWLEAHTRAWLVMQDTGEDDNTATERWFDAHAYRGGQQWIGTQRIVEYLLPMAGAVAAQGGPLAFAAGDARLDLDSFAVARGKAPGLWLIDLAWQGDPPPDLRFSVQALAADGSLLAQVDRTPGKERTAQGTFDRVGVAAPEDAGRLILKVYRADDGAVVPLEDGREYAVLADVNVLE